ncbi:DeoR/GlpR transcriptional regulator [Actinobacteria bacterium YIM 96077]|uniref:ArsR family transcriptional regulator n=1 Tax=Phytoactinopolyspora halophila TaxID=1981511 RepID=A0A329QC48_9ACTN|nr:DeoR/GlpR family DNA-binding transcription regulator [Phytoactinopolyspora halophila]AYY14111.1 DeoR/GlpR transcriptional regulator [Actinobacteria bacterium YIM 96077]RAW09953.1 ArsR family transcriptional regulator [Phytoactinopolyspora halophila]
MLAQRRYELIMQILRSEGPVAVGTLAERLGVSQATVRRDLDRLERQELLTRVRGGAAASTSVEPSFAEVATVAPDTRAAVARRAAELVRDGDVLLLDIGTTVHQLSKHLRGRSVAVMTANLAVYEELVPDPEIELILLGGVVRRNYRSLVGYLTEDSLRQVRASRLFMGTSGVRADGAVMDTTAIEVPVKRAMIAAADQVILMADDSKFPGAGFASVCTPDALNIVVTNEGADPGTLDVLRESGVEVIVA